MRALPLAAGINEGGHYFSYFSFFSWSSKKGHKMQAERGVADLFWGWNPSIFVSKEPMQNFGTLQHILNSPPPCPPKYVIVRVVGGSPTYFFDWNPNFVVT